MDRFSRIVAYGNNTDRIEKSQNILANTCYFRRLPGALTGMGLAITPLHAPRRFNPLALLDPIAQRVMGLALGYEDLNNHDRPSPHRLLWSVSLSAA
jgi:hypothetical protein